VIEKRKLELAEDNFKWQMANVKWQMTPAAGRQSAMRLLVASSNLPFPILHLKFLSASF